MKFHTFTAISQSVNWIWVVITLLVFSLLIKLGMWQSTRAIEKEQRLSRIVELQTDNALSLSQLMQNSDQGEEQLNDLPVLLDGYFEPEILFLLDNQPNKGQLGYKVYQVFNHEPYTLLVNLGWVLGSRDRNTLPDVTPITGPMKLTGNIRFIDVGVMLAEQNFGQFDWPLRVQQIEIDKFSGLINKQLLPFAVFLDKTEQIGYEKNWQPVVMPPEKHWGYAFQWF